MGAEPAASEGAGETPYGLARRLHLAGIAPEHVEQQLKALGLSEEEARIAARAGRGEAGGLPELQGHDAPASELPEAPPAEAPAHPCPKHAAWPVLGTCARCGTFFCVGCLKAAGLTRAPDGGRCPDCATRVTEAPAIGGWLVLPALSVGLFTPLTVIATLAGEAVELPKVEGPFVLPIVVELLVYGAFLAFTVFTAVQFFRRKRRAVGLMIAFYVLSIMVGLFGELLFAWLESIAGQPLESGEKSTVGRSVIAGVVWISYFVRSKRVQETFVFD